MRPRTLQPLVDDLTAAITAGRWRAGDRLPPQRKLAAERGLAASTVSLAYQALEARGLVVGETGRGTFVRVAPAEVSATVAEPSGTWADLALNIPTPAGLSALLAPALTALTRRPAALDHALRPVPVTGTAEARRAAAGWLSHDGWAVPPAHVLFTGSGKQGIAAAVKTLVPPGGRLGCDSLTYPVVKAIAREAGVEIVPLDMDASGTRPEAIAAAHARRPLHAVYLQPVLHNPVGVSMTPARRRAIAALLRRLDLTAIEDAIYAFLAPDARRLASEAPERVVVVDSFAKRVAPGLSIGVVVAPETHRPALADAIRAAAAGPGGLALDVCTRWTSDGVVARVVAAKQRDAQARQRLLTETLRGLAVQRDPRAYHAWLTLPDGWRADAFEAAARQAGIAVVPAAAFAVRAGHAPHAVRLALASPTMPALRQALRTLARLAAGPPRAAVTGPSPDERQPG